MLTPNFITAARIDPGAVAALLAGPDAGFDFGRPTQLVPGRRKALRHSMAVQERAMRLCQA